MYADMHKCMCMYIKDCEGEQLQEMTVLICSYVITLTYSTPGGGL